ncbi:hypothetical protein LUZ60_014794 [Juncus effusus]|nr:hypothetical protein LUZ60_014794 [Juncus effusus]
MEVEERSSSYSHGPPWLFKGSALYQLHLVKAETARAFIPKELNLVQAFGYTLGGLFLAHYDDSPAGKFDELVVIAGIVWNPPTSCAWAARVLVNSHEACHHGRKEVGLPSHVATFAKSNVAVGKKPLMKSSTSFLNMIGVNSTVYNNNNNQKDYCEINVSETNKSSQLSICNIRLPFTVPKLENSDRWIGPKIRISLPSFSGQTEDYPQLLKYSCKIECRVSAVKPARISHSTMNQENQENIQNNISADISSEQEAQERSISVLLSKPILALKFSSLKMHVGAPSNFFPLSGKNEVKYSST